MLTRRFWTAWSGREGAVEGRAVFVRRAALCYYAAVKFLKFLLLAGLLAGAAGCSSSAFRAIYNAPDALTRADAPAEQLSHFAFSPDGRVLAFTRHYQDGGRYKSAIGFADLQDGKFSQLHFADSAYAWAPSFSPDGDRLAFQVNFGESPGAERLALLDMKSMRYRFLTEPEGEWRFRPGVSRVYPGQGGSEREDATLAADNAPRQNPVFSMDGRRLLYQRPLLWKRDNFVEDMMPKDFMTLLFTPVMLFFDFSYFLNYGKVKVGWEIWEMNLQSGEERRIGEYRTYYGGGGYNGGPRYYGDDKIIFSGYVHVSDEVSKEHGDHRVYVTDTENPAPVKELEPFLTAEDFPAGLRDMSRSPRPSRSGAVLVVISEDSRPKFRYGVAVWDGGKARVLGTPDESDVSSPALSPDGRTAAYRALSYDHSRLKYWLVDVASGEARELSVPPREEWDVVEAASEEG